MEIDEIHTEDSDFYLSNIREIIDKYTTIQI